MAAPLGTAAPDRQGPPVGQRIVKLFIALAFAFIGYYLFADILGSVFSSARASKLENDFKEIAKAIDGYRIKFGKKFQDPDPEKLAGKTLESVPRDPEGRPYVYDWFFGKLVYGGPDGVLQTIVPGQKTGEGDSDDQTYRLWALSRIVYAEREESQIKLKLANADGSGVRTLVDVPGEVVGIAGLPDQNADVVIVAVKAGGRSRLYSVNVQADPAQLAPVTSGERDEARPTLYAAKSDWVFHQGIAPGQSTHRIFKSGYRDRQTTEMSTEAGDFVEPAADPKEHWVYYSGRQGAHYQLFRFQVSSYNRPEKVHAYPDRDLRTPSPSPSGEYLAYVVQDKGTAAIEVMALKGRRQVARIERVNLQTSLVWDPEGEKVGYFTADGHMMLTDVFRQVSTELPIAAVGTSFAWLHD